ncbi:RNA exonuclease, partial [Lachnellula suecica]
MFTSKGLFSEIQCPYQDTCVLPRCIFAHSSGQSRSAPVVAQNYVSVDNGQDQEGMRKRQKVAHYELPDTASEKPTSTNVIQPVEPSSLSSETRNPPQKVKRISTLTRPVSPPPLRNKPQNGISVLTKPLATQDATIPASKSGSGTASFLLKLASQKKAPIETPIKKEGLNPRPLKIPNPATHQMRFKLLQALHGQFKRLNSELEKDANDVEELLVLSEQALITKALDIEEEAAHTPTIYSNAVRNKILLYKKMTVKQWKEEREKDAAKAKAKVEASMSDTASSKPKPPPKVIETGLKTEEEIMLLPRLYTPITGLSKHGYVTAIPTEEEIETARKGVEMAGGWEVCDRCKSRFQAFPGRREEDGALTSGGKCTYHYGRTFFADRSASDPKAKREKRYKCCGEAMGDSAGCIQADHHVFSIKEAKRLASILNFEKTPENPAKALSNPVCIDGEMGYTVQGFELIRLTATSWPTGAPLFDVLVRPIGEILDLNSRYSGVWPKHMAAA